MLSLILCACLGAGPGQTTGVTLRLFGDDTKEVYTGHDGETTGQKALLHRVYTIPADAGVIRFTACAVRGPGCAANDKLDVALMAAGKRIIPKEVRTASGWEPVGTLLPAQDGQPHQYLWRVSEYAGQMVRIVLVDEDDRPGCYLRCGGFEVFGAGEFEDREFTEFMTRLTVQHELAPMTRYDTAHFTALSNAEESFSELRLQDCELLHGLFYDHFSRKGFPCRPSASKLMVAIFDNQAGFEACLGNKMSSLLTGIYHPVMNRMVMYDYGQNEALLSSKRRAERAGQRIGSQLERQQYLGAVQRQTQQYRQTANVGTIMHEVAHQLSFNCGMLNRHGDVPLWLAEGLACYCEPTANGSWQGIGEPDPERLQALAAALSPTADAREPHAVVPLLELRQLLADDRWVRGAKDARTLLLGYAQSWALFRMLMEQRPRALRDYLAVVYSRQIPDRRLADFGQAFGSLPQLEAHYQEYLQDLVQQYAPPKRNAHP
jgi:hypothetical protein